MGALYPGLEGKTVLITGGAGGIGVQLVRELARQRCRVAFIDIAVERARALVQEMERQGQSVRFEPCDVTDIPALQRTMAAVRSRLGPIQILINNVAGASDRQELEALTQEGWDRQVSVNLKHLAFCCQAVLPDMKAAGGGAIVNVGSRAWLSGEGGAAAHDAARAGVLGLTRSLARELGPHGIRVNIVVPGWLMSERDASPVEQEVVLRQCLKRRLEPIEVARFIVFLVSEEASACTGAQYFVDGGLA